MLKKILPAAMALVMTLCLAGCGEKNTAEDSELAARIVGGWVSVADDNFEYDEEGNLIGFGIYEFTGTETKYHYATPEQVESRLVNEYSIVGGLYKVIVEGQAQYAKVSFSSSGNLLWISDAENMEFRPLTEEEIETYRIPIGNDSIGKDNGYDEIDYGETQ